jgi:transcriptional regulator with XRE-family HTH domain
VRNEQRVIERLRTASVRFTDAQLERTCAIKSAHELGLSIRQIAAATGLSSSRIHQVLNTEDPAAIPIWATQLRDAAEKGNAITAEVKLLRQCTQWLKQLENGEEVIVNLRTDIDPETEYVRFDTSRVIRILERIAGDLDRSTEGAPRHIDPDPLSKRKRRLAEAPKPKRRLSTREERNALLAELKLPPT